MYQNENKNNDEKMTGKTGNRIKDDEIILWQIEILLKKLQITALKLQHTDMDLGAKLRDAMI